MQVFLVGPSDKSLPGPSAPQRPRLASEVKQKERLCQTDSLVMRSVHLWTDLKKRETDGYICTCTTIYLVYWKRETEDRHKSSTNINTSSVNLISAYLTICPSQMNDRMRERLRQDQMEHADDVDLSAESVDTGGSSLLPEPQNISHLICQG